MNDRRRDGVHAGAAVLGRHGQSEQVERPELPKERQVEALGAIVLQCLWLHLVAHELTDRLPK